eukprot:TRINITY_DN1908_c0_g2_i1.p1 TRINITY_DN1908_c0_g2~~TRINITY_DN1908_c0_g2_i1.p1  ORF type:complete len:572 (+),score=59.52 TRINITY_DN1908_c0_g2_i1:43-1758(+)
MDKVTCFFFLLCFFSVSSQSEICILCEETVSLLYNTLSSDFTKQGIVWIGTAICTMMGNSDNYCTITAGGLIEMLCTVIPEKFLNATYTCTYCGLCDEYIISQRYFRSFQQNVLKATPPMKGVSKIREKKRIKLLQISDLHLEPYYAQYANADCQEDKCCRVDSGTPKREEDKAGYWGTVGRCDIPARTIRSALNFIGRELKPDFVIWLGDNEHGPSFNVSKESEMQIISELTKMMKEELGHTTPIFPVLGNHEGHPIDMFNYRNLTQERWLLDGTAEIWSSFFDSNAKSQYLQTGYYTQLVPFAPKLRIIGLNSLLYEPNNFYSIVNSTDPLGQIQWLSEVLAKAEKNQESVLVITHIPTCCDRGTDSSTSRMVTLFERYSNIIRGVFAGHYHVDFVRVLRSFTDGTPFGLEFVSPSLTTSTRVNPAFNLLELDSDTFQILEVTKYLMDINESNRQMRPIWNRSHDLKAYYQLEAVTPKELYKLSERIETDEYWYKLFCRSYVSDSFDADTFINLGKKGMHYFPCLMRARTHAEFAECLDFDFLIFPEEEEYYYLQLLQSSWADLIKRTS